MDVRKENFDHVFPEIRKSIEDAAFIAIDGEFTGLSTSPIYEPALYDTQEDRYRKYLRSLSNFCICQCGLSMYVPSKESENGYTVHTFNFFLNPPSFGPIDSKFLMQASAIEFLCTHNFDFNACFQHGVSYMNRDQEKLFWDHHKRNIIQSNISSVLQRQYDEKFIDPAIARINKYLASGSVEDALEISTIPKGLPQYLFLKTVEKLYSNVSCFLKKNGTILVKRNDEICDHEKQYDFIASQIVGFSAVIQLISQLKKPIVGHNMLGDMILMYKMFFHSLPTTYAKFKSEIHHLFPVIYDTKHIAFSLRREFRNVDFFECTSLGELYDVLSSSSAMYYKLYTPQIKHAEGFDKYVNGGGAVHEAGYDAYLTGYIFLRLAHLAATKNIRSTESRPMEWHDHIQALSSFKNCLNITRAAVRFLNFEGPDPACNFPECFLVRLKNNSRGSLSANQVAQDFLPWGSVDVKVRPGGQEAFVAVSHRKMSKDVVQAFARNKFYVVMKYRWYHTPEWRTATRYVAMGTCGALLMGAIYVLAKNTM